ncbi:MAG: sodium:proton antiporter [Verrucomicrobiia bacterium]
MLYEPSVWMILPFVGLLGTIALAPLICPQWWSKHYPKVAFAFAAVTLIYYLFILPSPAKKTVLHTGHEYISFIALIGSLFVVSGGIHIGVKGESKPGENVLFLFIGAVIANLLGTTGASMLLIRPWIRMNKYRITAYHIVFFIFIVSNVGGCLTPIGDPPLFLGYLKGIPFWWVLEHCWQMWAVGVGILLGIFYIIDKRNYYKAPKPVRDIIAEPPDVFRFEGLHNIVFLGMILGAVFINEPIFVREIIMIAAAVGSYFTTRREIHESNHFNFHPIIEVAVLFFGIFSTMMPALDWLKIHAGELGSPTPAFYFYATGILSSFLDNAPTYLTFLSSVFGAVISPDVISQVQHLIQTNGADLATVSEPVRQTFMALQKYHASALAKGSVTIDEIEIAYLIGNVTLNNFIVSISVGAVFFGACTYIGNGPNFMVKSIADQQKIHVPTFLGYIIKYTVPYMLPMLAIVWLIFFRK